MDIIKDLECKKDMLINILVMGSNLLLEIEQELKKERMKKLLKEIKERMYESNEK